MAKPDVGRRAHRSELSLESPRGKLSAADREPHLEIEASHRVEQCFVIATGNADCADERARRRGLGCPESFVDRLEREAQLMGGDPEPRSGDPVLLAAVTHDRPKVRVDTEIAKHERGLRRGEP